MPVVLYSHKLRREVLLLSDEEYRPIATALADRAEAIKAYRQRHGVSLAEARRHSGEHALERYERLTGLRLEEPDQLYWVRLSDYGRPCPACGKPFRTPNAALCAECGYSLPAGEVAGPASASPATG